MRKETKAVSRWNRALAGLALGWTMALPAMAASEPAADLILSNGDFYLRENGWAKAIAIKDGAIVAIGDAAAVKKFQGAKTELIDLKGAAVLPGFHDMHVHPQRGGWTSMQCMIPFGSTPEQIHAVVKGCASRMNKGDWITGRGWTNSVFKDKVQDKTLLDSAAPDNPVLLQDETGHSSWSNSLALKMAGITRDTPDPAVGVIEHDARGEPNGLLRESAGGLVRALVPPPSAEQSEAALERAFRAMLSNGITSIRDASGNGMAVNSSSMPDFASLYDKGVKMPRSEICMRWNYDISGVDESFEAFYAQRNLYRRPLVMPDCVKLSGDGVPGDGHTAFMLEPYMGVKETDTEQYKYGFMNVPPAVMKKLVPRFDADNMSMLIHCCGDGCARVALDSIELARKQNGYNGRMHQIGHNNFTTKEDLARGPALGASFEFSAYLYYLNPATQTYLTAIGPERFKRYKPYRDALDAGAVVTTGSDWPVSASTDPWVAIETLVTREKPGGGGPKLGASQMISLAEAVDVYTVNPAKQFGHADRVGRIKTGYLADLIVLDRNPFRIPVTEVHKIKTKMTLVNGAIAWKADGK